MAMKALFLNFILKKSPRVSSTQASIDRSAADFREPDIKGQVTKVIDYDTAFRNSSNKEEENECNPSRVKACYIPFMVTPIWSELLSIVKVAAKGKRRDKTYTRGDLKTGGNFKTGQYYFFGKVTEDIISGIRDRKQNICCIKYNLMSFSELLEEKPVPVSINNLLRRQTGKG